MLLLDSCAYAALRRAECGEDRRWRGETESACWIKASFLFPNGSLPILFRSVMQAVADIGIIDLTSFISEGGGGGERGAAGS